MGANHVGEIDFLCKIAQPTHGVITNIGRAHLEGFGGYEGVKKAKGELYQWLKAKNGTFFINTDDDTLKEMLPADVKSIKYGCSNGDVSGERDNKDRLNLAVSISSKDGQNTLIKTNLIGDYNIDNILAATSIGRYFKVDMEQVRAAIENYIPDNNRSQLLEIGTNKFILDAYNANPTSMKLALQNLEHYSVENKVVILGDMMELGDDSQQEHEGIINQSLAMKINKIVLVGTQFKAVADAMDTSQTLLCFDTAIETKEWMQLQEFTNTVFLIKGSRKVQLEKIISD